MVNEWTRDDLPTVDEAAETYMTKGVYSVQEGIALVLDAVVAHLNANGELPADDRWRRPHWIVEQERNQAREQWKKWEYKANEWMARAEAAEARTAPADPAVLVIGESDVEACQARRQPPSSLTSKGDWESANQTWLYSKGVTVEELDEEIDVNIRGVIEALAVRRAIEAEAEHVDLVEGKAVELHKAAHGDMYGFGYANKDTQEMFRRIAEHVLGQEDRHVEQ